MELQRLTGCDEERIEPPCLSAIFMVQTAVSRDRKIRRIEVEVMVRLEMAVDDFRMAAVLRFGFVDVLRGE
jgi:hypothetical protein